MGEVIDFWLPKHRNQLNSFIRTNNREIEGILQNVGALRTKLETPRECLVVMEILEKALGGNQPKKTNLQQQFIRLKRELITNPI